MKRPFVARENIGDAVQVDASRVFGLVEAAPVATGPYQVRGWGCNQISALEVP